MRLRSTERAEDHFAPIINLDDDLEPAERTQRRHVDIDPLIGIIHAPYDRLAVQARDIQSTLSALRLPNGRAPGSIAMIAVDAQEEAAVLNANIAVSAALSGVSTLLVDMAQSGFVQHGLLRAKPKIVPADELDDLHQAIQASSITGLSLMAMSIMDDVNADASALSAIARRLPTLSTHFDLCLVDASHIDDLAIAAASAEGVILIVHRDATHASRLKATINKLSMLNAPLIGTVMLV